MKNIIKTGMALLLITMSAITLAAPYSVNPAQPGHDSYFFSGKGHTSYFNVVVNPTCNAQPGGRICVQFVYDGVPSPDRCGLSLPANGQPNRFYASLPTSTETDLILTMDTKFNPNNAASACGTVS